MTRYLVSAGFRWWEVKDSSQGDLENHRHPTVATFRMEEGVSWAEAHALAQAHADHLNQEDRPAD